MTTPLKIGALSKSTTADTMVMVSKSEGPLFLFFTGDHLHTLYLHATTQIPHRNLPETHSVMSDSDWESSHSPRFLPRALGRFQFRKERAHSESAQSSLNRICMKHGQSSRQFRSATFHEGRESDAETSAFLLSDVHSAMLSISHRKS